MALPEPTYVDAGGLRVEVARAGDVLALMDALGHERDPVRRFVPAEAMRGWGTRLREPVIVEGAGHWVQPQAPEAVNAALLDLLQHAR
jgi:hypothetical protein